MELIQFHKRLYEEFNSLPSPRVFLVSAHSKETPNIITARMVISVIFRSSKAYSIAGDTWASTQGRFTSSKALITFTYGLEVSAKRRDCKVTGLMHRST